MVSLFRHWRTLPLFGLPLLVITLLAVLPPATSSATTLSSGFQEEVALSGLIAPTDMVFVPNSTDPDNPAIYVAEKSGLIKYFRSLDDTNPVVFKDLRIEVFSHLDRGLLAIAIDPRPDHANLYALYSYDHILGDSSAAPRWGDPTTPTDTDPCPDPPGVERDGCITSGRLVRIPIEAGTTPSGGDEQVLIEDWCHQYSTHSIGALEFGSDNALYVSAGDGASPNFTDYGQGGGSANSPTPKNPCGDPPAGVGGTMNPASSMGGSFRSQSLLRGDGQPVALNGALLRVDPDSGAGLSTNPLGSNSNANARRIIAEGLRNPFRFTFRPGTSEIWIGDVGQASWETVWRLQSPTPSIVANMGWPCYEAAALNAQFQNLSNTICTQVNALQSSSSTKALNYRMFRYRHNVPDATGSLCRFGAYGQTSTQASVTAVAFYEGGNYPSQYDGALVLGDYSRGCIWVLPKLANGTIDTTSTPETLVDGASSPVQIRTGPNGDLFYLDHLGGKLRRIRYYGDEPPPIAMATADQASGAAPLTVHFDGSASSDPAGGTLSYSWDFNGDGQFGDADQNGQINTATPTVVYTAAGTYQVKLRVTNQFASRDSAAISIVVSSAAPDPDTIQIHSQIGDGATTQWKVGDAITFSGSGSTVSGNPLPNSSYSWNVVIYHCYSENIRDCHEHAISSYSGPGPFHMIAPDHEYPSQIQIRLTVQNAGAESTKQVALFPYTANLNVRSIPSALEVTVGSTTGTTPFTQTVIMGSVNSISAAQTQQQGAAQYLFNSWSDGGARVQDLTVDKNLTLTAEYTLVITPSPEPPTSTTTPPPTSTTTPLPTSTTAPSTPVPTTPTTQPTAPPATSYRVLLPITRR